MKAVVIIEKGQDGTYDANMQFYKKLDFGLFGQGNTVQDAIQDFYNTYEEMKTLYKEEGKHIVQLEFEFKYDMASFLSYYSNILTLSGLERLTGVNQGQLSHYVTGHRKPSKKTTEKIEKKLHEFAEDLHQVTFI